MGFSFKKKRNGGGDSGDSGPTPTRPTSKAPSRAPTEQDLRGNSDVSKTVAPTVEAISPLLTPDPELDQPKSTPWVRATPNAKAPPVPSREGRPVLAPPVPSREGRPQLTPEVVPVDKQTVEPKPLEQAPVLIAPEVPSREGRPQLGLQGADKETVVAPPLQQPPEVIEELEQVAKQTVAPIPLEQAPEVLPQVVPQVPSREGRPELTAKPKAVLPLPVVNENISGDKLGAKAKLKGNTDQLRGRHFGKAQKDATDKSDSAHKVERVDFSRKIGQSKTNKGFFKPEDDIHKSWLAHGAGIGNIANVEPDQGKSGPKPEKTRGIARSLASTRVNRAMGQDTYAEEVQARHKGKWGVVSAKTDGRSVAEAGDEIDYKKAETQRGFMNVGFMDYLTGQVDRHEGNLYWDPETGHVRGIDNDLSFGKGNATTPYGNNFGLPSHIDEKTAEAFMKLGRDEYEALLGGEKGDKNTLTTEEIEAALERYDKLRRYIEGEEIDGKTAKIVSEWDEQTYEELTESLRTLTGEERQLNSQFQSDNNATNLLERSAYYKQAHAQKG